MRRELEDFVRRVSDYLQRAGKMASMYLTMLENNIDMFYSIDSGTFSTFDENGAELAHKLSELFQMTFEKSFDSSDGTVYFKGRKDGIKFRIWGTKPECELEEVVETITVRSYRCKEE